jgi:hypothetical protein
LKLLVWVKIGYVKSSLNGEFSPNLVTLVPATLGSVSATKKKKFYTIATWLGRFILRTRRDACVDDVGDVDAQPSPSPVGSGFAGSGLRRRIKRRRFYRKSLLEKRAPQTQLEK